MGGEKRPSKCTSQKIIFSHPVDRDSIRKIPATWRKRGIHGFEITFHALSRLKGVPCPIPAKNTGPFLRPTPDQHRSGCLGSQNEMKFGHRVGSRTFHEQKPGRESSGKPVPISLRERSCVTKPPQRLMPGGQTAPAPESWPVTTSMPTRHTSSVNSLWPENCRVSLTNPSRIVPHGSPNRRLTASMRRCWPNC